MSQPTKPPATSQSAIPEHVLDYARELVASVLTSIEKGEPLGWTRPWVAFGEQYGTRAPYSGWNQIITWVVAVHHGYLGNRWFSKSRGERQKGEDGKRWRLKEDARGVIINAPDRAWRAESDTREEAEWTQHVVYNETQFVGAPIPATIEVDGDQALSRVGSLLRAVGLDLKICAYGNAYFDIEHDRIALPAAVCFARPTAYAATALHELVHWTGHATRLARDMGAHGTAAYAFEELVAELGAAMLASALGITEARVEDDNHRGYLRHWAEELRDKPEELLRALHLAASAFAFLRELCPAAFTSQPLLATDPPQVFPQRLADGGIWRSPFNVTYSPSSGSPTPDLVVHSEVAEVIEAWWVAWLAWQARPRSEERGQCPLLVLEGELGDGAGPITDWLRRVIGAGQGVGLAVRSDGTPITLAASADGLRGGSTGRWVEHVATSTTTLGKRSREATPSHDQGEPRQRFVADLVTHPVSVATLSYLLGHYDPRPGIAVRHRLRRLADASTRVSRAFRGDTRSLPEVACPFVGAFPILPIVAYAAGLVLAYLSGSTAVGAGPFVAQHGPSVRQPVSVAAPPESGSFGNGGRRLTGEAAATFGLGAGAVPSLASLIVASLRRLPASPQLISLDQLLAPLTIQGGSPEARLRFTLEALELTGRFTQGKRTLALLTRRGLGHTDTFADDDIRRCLDSPRVTGIQRRGRGFVSQPQERRSPALAWIWEAASSDAPSSDAPKERQVVGDDTHDSKTGSHTVAPWVELGLGAL